MKLSDSGHFFVRRFVITDSKKKKKSKENFQINQVTLQFKEVKTNKAQSYQKERNNKD